jgi:hypothetical protein
MTEDQIRGVFVVFFTCMVLFFLWLLWKFRNG